MREADTPQGQPEDRAARSITEPASAFDVVDNNRGAFGAHSQGQKQHQG
jgi:hypothetical protein